MTAGRSSIRPLVVSSLQAFWPALLVLAGDIDQAQLTFKGYYDLWNVYGSLPEGYQVSKCAFRARASCACVSSHAHPHAHVTITPRTHTRTHAGTGCTGQGWHPSELRHGLPTAAGAGGERVRVSGSTTVP
jgi:hypothetical protein